MDFIISWYYEQPYMHLVLSQNGAYDSEAVAGAAALVPGH